MTAAILDAVGEMSDLFELISGQSRGKVGKSQIAK